MLHLFGNNNNWSKCLTWQNISASSFLKMENCPFAWSPSILLKWFILKHPPENDKIFNIFATLEDKLSPSDIQAFSLIISRSQLSSLLVDGSLRPSGFLQDSCHYEIFSGTNRRGAVTYLLQPEADTLSTKALAVGKAKQKSPRDKMLPWTTWGKEMSGLRFMKSQYEQDMNVWQRDKPKKTPQKPEKK